MSLLQSVCAPAFVGEDLSLTALCKVAAEIGFRAIELWSPGESLPETVAIAREHGLVVSSFTGHDSIDHGLNDPSHFDRIESELAHSLELAAKFEVPGIICFSGSRLATDSDMDGLTTFIRAARKIVARAERAGVNLNLEILNSRVDHPTYQCDRVDWAIAACEAIGSPRFKLLFDIYHVQIMEGDLIRNLRRAMPYIGHVHTAGNPGRHELDDTQEISYPALARTLVEGGYTGYVGHEFFARRPDKVAALKQAFQACRGA